MKFAHPNNPTNLITKKKDCHFFGIQIGYIFLHRCIKSYDEEKQTKRIIDCGKSHESWTPTVTYSISLVVIFLLPDSFNVVSPFVLIFLSLK